MFQETLKAFFAAAIQVEVGSGEDILFWTERWLHGGSIAEVAPNLAIIFAMAVSKEARIKAVHSISSLDQQKMGNRHPRGSQSPSAGRIFESLGVGPSLLEFHSIWVVFLCNTADRLAKRGLPHPNVCPSCGPEQETMRHLLVSCVFSHELWTLILNALGLSALVLQPDEGIFMLVVESSF
ncbi:hypothetical protein U9M48_003117 [Paspalum notatum var. saurae]|uniref:Reverse transcriptase zinc-binding domain-containing protein n=1 Tax=Paspalum notatum var. saurae TaxID=547442 RepID=A0AAQ3SHZ1_PASNO